MKNGRPGNRSWCPWGGVGQKPSYRPERKLPSEWQVFFLNIRNGRWIDRSFPRRTRLRIGPMDRALSARRTLAAIRVMTSWWPDGFLLVDYANRKPLNALSKGLILVAGVGFVSSGFALLVHCEALVFKGFLCRTGSFIHLPHLPLNHPLGEASGGDLMVAGVGFGGTRLRSFRPLRCFTPCAEPW